MAPCHPSSLVECFKLCVKQHALVSHQLVALQHSAEGFSVRCFDNHSKLQGYSVAAKDKKKLIEAEAVLSALADGKTMTTPSRKKRNP